MIYCRNCTHWIDESLEAIEADHGGHAHVFMGCRVYGLSKGRTELESCDRYDESEDLYGICNTCRLTVPRICITFQECINCTDTDLFCVGGCIGGDARKYCSHFARLLSRGIQLIEDDKVFDVFPNLGMPEKKKAKE